MSIIYLSFFLLEESSPCYNSNRKVAALHAHPLPVSLSSNSTRVEIPSRKIAPSDPSLAEETRPKRVIGKTDPNLPLSNLKTKTAVRRPHPLEKPKQKCASAASTAATAAYITPYSWRRGHSIASQLLRSKSLSEGSLSSSPGVSASQAAPPLFTSDE